jgi:predicted RNase H-like HicB family nuclease
MRVEMTSADRGRVQIGMRLWLDIESKEEGAVWSAFCETFPLAATGQTETEAIRNLKQTIQAYVSVLNRRKVLLRTLDTKAIRHQAIQVDNIPSGKIPVDVLYEF